MDKDDGITRALVHTGHATAIHLEILLLVAHFRVNKGHAFLTGALQEIEHGIPTDMIV